MSRFCFGEKNCTFVRTALEQLNFPNVRARETGFNTIDDYNTTKKEGQYGFTTISRKRAKTIGLLQ